MITETAETGKNDSKLQRIRSLNAQRKRTVALSPFEYRQNATEATVDWINGWDVELDVACCWHAATAVRNQQGGNSDAWLQKELATYFRSILAAVYGDIPERKRPNLPRFITLEHTAGVGWHAHGLIARPSHLSLEQFSAVLRDVWQQQMGDCENDVLGERIFWCEQRDSGYLRYILKSVNDKDGLRYGELRGLIDWRNTRRP